MFVCSFCQFRSENREEVITCEKNHTEIAAVEAVAKTKSFGSVLVSGMPTELVVEFVNKRIGRYILLEEIDIVEYYVNQVEKPVKKI